MAQYRQWQFDEKIPVRISRHAAWDSIPLRFGKNVKDGSEGVFEGRELQAKAHSDGTWYDGELRLENSVTIEGKFLLGRAVEAGKRTVVTVLLPQENPREYGAGVSKVIAGLREGGTIKPHEIAKKLHRPYVNGEIDTTDKLMQLLGGNDSGGVEGGKDEVSREAEERPQRTTSAGTPRYTQEQFRQELQKMIDEARARGEARVRVIARELHKRVVTNTTAGHRMPMACIAMWDLYHRKGGRVIHTTPSGKSTTIEIEYKTGG